MNPIVEFFRGIGALMVLNSHYAHYLSSERCVLNFLWTGVYLFFVISGYVFGKLIYTGNEQILSFAAKRFFRIYPLYALSLIFYYLVSGNNSSGNVYFIRHLLFLNTTSSVEEAFYFNPAYWSLPVEMEFYMFIPLLIYFRNKIGPKIIYIIFLASLGLKFFVNLKAGRMPSINTYSILGLHLVGMFPEFGVGILMYRLALSASRLRRYYLIVPLITGGLLLAYCAGYFIRYGDDGIYDNLIMRSFFSTFCSLGYALILLPAMELVTKTPKKIFFLLGSLSYGVYLFHNLIPKVFSKFNITIEGIYAYALATALTAILAFICNRIVEVPFRDYGRKLAARFAIV